MFVMMCIRSYIANIPFLKQQLFCYFSNLRSRNNPPRQAKLSQQTTGSFSWDILIEIVMIECNASDTLYVLCTCNQRGLRQNLKLGKHTLHSQNLTPSICTCCKGPANPVGFLRRVVASHSRDARSPLILGTSHHIEQYGQFDTHLPRSRPKLFTAASPQTLCDEVVHSLTLNWDPLNWTWKKHFGFIIKGAKKRNILTIKKYSNKRINI
jgi:hypothetical protein